MILAEKGHLQESFSNLYKPVPYKDIFHVPTYWKSKYMANFSLPISAVYF